MTYTEKELDQFLHGISLSLLSKKSAQHWRYDEETAKEIEWLEALERKVRADKADRKTEPKPCEWCKFYDGENCFSQEPCNMMLYFKTEPQYDFSEYADRLWKIAYERGKREAEQTEPKTESE